MGKKRGTRHSFIEFAFAKSVTKDFPKLIRLMDKFVDVLSPYGQYKSVWLVIQSMRDNQMMLKIQLDHYKDVYEKKGEVVGE